MKLTRYVDLQNGLAILKEKKLRLSNPRYFNDPFDCRVSVDDKDPNWVAEIPLAKGAGACFGMRPREEFWKYNSLIQTCVDGKDREELKDYRVICFNGSVNPFQDALMWGHYADSHSGVKITFNDEFYEFITNEFEFYEVIYKNNRIKIKYLDDDTVVDEKIYKSLYHKSLIWRDENEYRIIYNVNTNHKNVLIGEFNSQDGTTYEAEYINLAPKWIEHIDISCNIRKAAEDEVLKIVKSGFNVQVRKARICVEHYELHYELIPDD